MPKKIVFVKNLTNTKYIEYNLKIQPYFSCMLESFPLIIHFKKWSANNLCVFCVQDYYHCIKSWNSNFEFKFMKSLGKILWILCNFSTNLDFIRINLLEMFSPIFFPKWGIENQDEDACIIWRYSIHKKWERSIYGGI